MNRAFRRYPHIVPRVSRGTLTEILPPVDIDMWQGTRDARGETITERRLRRTRVGRAVSVRYLPARTPRFIGTVARTRLEIENSNGTWY